ncbi:MAG: Maf-like protein [Gammaproteobacteria bacterium]|nr:Maf-like protein [Gammaproteobacteria bacterium]MDH5653669.1 Maf-like protein [Gammaproteobacteria bacterium]
MNQEDFDLYLASASPRRQELLQQIGVRYRIVVNDVAEIPNPDESPETFALRVAVDKARTGWANLPVGTQKPVLGADTVVTIDNHILGKPRDREHALAMLAQLSGRTHQVLTAVALMAAGTVSSAVSRSEVTFREISAGEREWYWRTNEPVDKAGAYAIQGRAAVFIRRLEGSYSGVMGLPLYETAALLQKAGIVSSCR